MCTNYTELPIAAIKTRQYCNIVKKQAEHAGLPPIIARVLAARSQSGKNIIELIEPKLSTLTPPSHMLDIELAAKRLAEAIINKECVGIETDHDCDGQTSHAVIYHNLVKHFRHPKKLIRSYISHRLTEGYGLSESVANRILADRYRPSLLITADNGSSDEPRITKLKQQGIDVIVTDHHQIPNSGPPKSAYAFINPSREDCDYDPFIAGCMVAWLLMAATRQQLINLNYLPKDAPKLLDSLDYVAVGTVADCVSFAKSHTNRAVVKFGLKLLNLRNKFCWQALDLVLPGLIEAEDLGFKIAPLLNSDGRLACAFGSVSFLLSESISEAKDWLAWLQTQNKQRRYIQQQLTFSATKIAKQQVDGKKHSICIFLADGHPGVHGISASKIKDYFGRPVGLFSPKIGEDDLITGSLRGVENFHVRDALQYVAEHSQGLMVAFGGHQGAGGVTIIKNRFPEFARLFEAATIEQISMANLGPVIWSDGELPIELINLKFFNELRTLEPYGKDFEIPIFHNQGIVTDWKIIGDGTHARVNLAMEGVIFKGVWFNAKQHKAQPWGFTKGDKVICAFKLLKNVFNNQESCELNIVGIQKLKIT